MKNLLTIDEKNYDESLPEIKRVAVRGIIWIDEKIVFIESKSGELKIPGGGQEENETDLQTLVREVQEETGYVVKPESVKPFGQIVERRMASYEPMIWNQTNRIYFCEVEETQVDCNYSQHEKELGYKLVCYTVEEALEHNRKYFAENGEEPEKDREYLILKMMKELTADARR